MKLIKKLSVKKIREGGVVEKKYNYRYKYKNITVKNQAGKDYYIYLIGNIQANFGGNQGEIVIDALERELQRRGLVL